MSSRQRDRDCRKRDRNGYPPHPAWQAQQELDPSLETQVHQGVEGIEGRPAQDFRDLRRVGGDPLKRAIQVYISGMDEGKGDDGHGPNGASRDELKMGRVF
jgi:hypothetical protein